MGAFLCGDPGPVVVSWELGHHNYTALAHGWLRRRFGHARVGMVSGDSRLTVPTTPHKSSDPCDLVFIDGGHFGDVPLSDMVSFTRLAQAGSVIIVDDCVPRSLRDLTHRVPK